MWEVMRGQKFWLREENKELRRHHPNFLEGIHLGFIPETPRQCLVSGIAAPWTNINNTGEVCSFERIGPSVPCLTKRGDNTVAHKF